MGTSCISGGHNYFRHCTSNLLQIRDVAIPVCMATTGCRAGFVAAIACSGNLEFQIRYVNVTVEAN